MGDLVRFLMACLDEDERMARACSGAPWEIEIPPMVHVSVKARRDNKWKWGRLGYVASVERDEDRAHIAQHDPARALREINGKRQLVNAHARGHECIELSGSGEHSVVDGKPWEHWEPRHTLDYGPCFVLRCLALPYADRPDFRPEWRP